MTLSRGCRRFCRTTLKIVCQCAIPPFEQLSVHPRSEFPTTEAKMMSRMTNEEKDTALYVAARNIQAQVVKILTKEDPEFSYSANVHGETPLYIAASIMPRWSEERGKVC